MSLCGEEHPVWRVQCLKKTAHDGDHWFASFWKDREDAIERAVNALTAHENYLELSRDQIRAVVEGLADR